ncbi:bifunctional pyr operon transcriptional regulator/uracil phosphoribosyltransferase [Alkalilimnicola ehrlichii]|uniref:Bifunctional pyr operon transcriptional regulator/uracil phosphoribosyltransferase n=1 Tax=Alkalilimnicola ehrlichii TaxID=351052 RepID=A0A3E0X462_9GAMM|nr:bifunctional pyr operon transcriptional regulator/uracil phosphoribosyltransferase PyrR [Alkalilimnicola ehrlichii]RFA31205.1 bifunctional pyr operon transcriptional regulator/uracil phosphoribosyltransferase [Alkalilimnicola ehrlichii]RFA39514.1 bifunctional pyr operon transcriptional regulator/uracil phosphoribosyltransferase [Alkalilimnicola ehrlichii]
MTTLPAVDPLIEHMAGELKARLDVTPSQHPVMIGIRTGGVWVAERLHAALGLPDPLGTLDITFYRDDFSRVGMNPQVHPSHLPFSVDDRDIILVDDVLYTGRTIRAALNEIFDYGRPASVQLAVLVDRGGRELPIAADVAGTRLQLAEGRHIKLSGPSPLSLTERTQA